MFSKQFMFANIYGDILTRILDQKDLIESLTFEDKEDETNAVVTLDTWEETINCVIENKIFIHDRSTSPNDYLEIHNSTEKYLILTTDNMNSSLTMINIGSIIDLMSEEIVYDHNSRIINETKSLADTRMNRSGRMFSSSCVRMTKSNIFNTGKCNSIGMSLFQESGLKT